MLKYILENSITARVLFYYHLSHNEVISVADLRKLYFIESSGVPRDIMNTMSYEYDVNNETVRPLRRGRRRNRSSSRESSRSRSPRSTGYRTPSPYNSSNGSESPASPIPEGEEEEDSPRSPSPASTHNGEEGENGNNSPEEDVIADEVVNDPIQPVSNEVVVVSDGALCNICYVKKVDTLFLPCRHLISCRDCSSTWKGHRELSPRGHTCPKCQTEVVETISGIFIG